jgi:DNA polymerase/3'-5' exonuclease PolX
VEDELDAINGGSEECEKKILMSMSNLQEERQDHAHHGRNQVAHRLVRAILRVTRVSVTIAGHLSRARARAILLHRVHSNIPS